jgi:hypothetical protein
MMEDNIRYTAMRIFQDIESADVVYINTYAATTPRLSAFKKICSTNSKEPELIEPNSAVVPRGRKQRLFENSGSEED